MVYLDILLFVVGAVLLVVGYSKNKRDIMLVAALMLFLSGALSSFIEGFVDGYSAGMEETRQSSVVSASSSRSVAVTSAPAFQLNPVFALVWPGRY